MNVVQDAKERFNEPFVEICECPLSRSFPIACESPPVSSESCTGIRKNHRLGSPFKKTLCRWPNSPFTETAGQTQVCKKIHVRKEPKRPKLASLGQEILKLGMMEKKNGRICTSVSQGPLRESGKRERKDRDGLTGIAAAKMHVKCRLLYINKFDTCLLGSLHFFSSPNELCS